MNTQEYIIKKTENGYSVRRIIYGGKLLSAPVEINLPEDKLHEKYKNYNQYCAAINRLIEAELSRIASENFGKGD